MTQWIPAHTASLEARDFVPALAAPFRGRAYREIDLARAWEGRLDRVLVPTPTGRHALWYFLELCRGRLQPGDQVVVAGYNFYVVVRILLQWGLVPVFADVEPDTLCLDPGALAGRVTERTRLVVVTHMFGNPADTDAIAGFCRARGILLFEDCAHAAGTLDARGAQVGQAGDGALFSFGVQKIVNTFGGGMLAAVPEVAAAGPLPSHDPARLEAFACTASRFVASAVMHPAVAGWSVKPAIGAARFLARRGWTRFHRVLEPARDDPSYRFHPDERAPLRPFMRRMLQRQLARLDENVRRRRAVRALVRDALARVEEIGWLDEDAHGRSNAAYFGIYVPDPAALAAFLAERGISSNPREFYDCGALPQFAEHAARCPHSARVSAHLLRLPSYPDLGEQGARRIASAIEAFFVRAPVRARPTRSLVTAGSDIG